MWPFKKKSPPTTQQVIKPQAVVAAPPIKRPKTYGEKMLNLERGQWTVRVYFWVDNPEELPNGGHYEVEEATGRETYAENVRPEAQKMYESLMRKHGGAV
jgi:hypothetical protein